MKITKPDYPDWLDVWSVIAAARAYYDGPGAAQSAFISACIDNKIGTRWKLHHLGPRALHAHEWKGASVDIQTGRVTQADGTGMAGVQARTADVEAWFKSTAPGWRGAGLAEKADPPALASAKNVLTALWPNGVPPASAIRTKDLHKQVAERLKQNGLSTVSKETVSRAAGRRKERK